MNLENKVLDYTSFFSQNCSSKYVTHDDMNRMANIINKDFSIIHFNTRNLMKTFESIQSVLQSNGVAFTIIGSPETWLSDSNNFECIAIPDYEVCFK